MARGERLKRFDEYLEEEIGRRDLEQRKNNFNFICHIYSPQRNQDKRCKTVFEKEEDFSHDIETAVIRDA